MNELQIFKNPDFGEIRTIQLNGEPWFVAADVCKALELGDVNKVMARIDKDEGTRIEIPHPQSTGKMLEVNAVNEPGLYSLVLGSRKPEAKAFKRWITHKVIPSIRKTGMYAFPKDYISALRAYVESEEKRIALEAENEVQRQTIADFQPIKQYVDVILSSEDMLTITQIAADYGISARKMNEILHEEGIQHKVNGQWVLYRKHMGMGYTKSETFNFSRRDGSTGVKLLTKWSQKGRMFLHQIMESRGIRAVMDREPTITFRLEEA